MNEGDMMNLDERKKQILSAIIESYISTAEPVGSRTIAKNHPFHLSSATIRNEMADLEDMGLLEQPHTSAGRIPSDKGYRFYVDQLMGRYKLTMDEIAVLRSLMELRIAETDMLIKEISSIYSRMTKYTIVALSPETMQATIKQLQMMVIDNYSVLLVIITSASTVKTKEISVSHPLSNEFLNQLSSMLNHCICGRSISQIDAKEIMRIKEQMLDYHELLKQIWVFVYESLDDVGNSNVFLGGTTNILNYPEYNNISKARQLLEFLDDKANVKKIFTPLAGKKQVQVLIGSENLADEMKDCSIVLSQYHIKDEQYGAIGVIGPTRMDYSRAVSMLEFFTDQLRSSLEDEDE